MSERQVSIIIQSRLSSSRLPAKALLPLGGYPSVVLCALRAGNTGLPVTVATSLEPSDNSIAEVLQNNNISCFRGELDNVLLRFTQAAESCGDQDLIIRLTADNVFPDGSFLEFLLKEFDAKHFDYLSTSFPEDVYPYGLSAEIFKVGTLREANKKANTDFDREHVTPYIKRHFRCQPLHSENIPFYWNKLRCTLDTFTDYLQLLPIFQHIESPVTVSWYELIKTLESLTHTPLKTENYTKLTLGAAQLGMTYGIANEKGFPCDSVANNLIHQAVKAGIKTLDTARAYGLSEQRIGTALNRIENQIQVISKLHTLDYLYPDASEQQVRHAVRASIYESCYQLQMRCVDTLLMHRWAHRHQWNAAAWKELLALKKAGIIKTLGVSVATPLEAISALLDTEIAHIQCPVNILDSRWWQKDFLSALTNRPDVVIFARSTYLQGLLIMPVTNWPEFAAINVLEINRILDYLVTRFNRLNRQDLCLAYVRGLPWVSSLVIGMETEDQLQGNLKLFGEKPLTTAQIEEIQQLVPPLPEHFLNPAQWRFEHAK
ncbi:MAG: aldo/keto reductase [Legionella sp.]|nr:aldo/keto reductase [Legionella sp.]